MFQGDFSKNIFDDIKFDIITFSSDNSSQLIIKLLPINPAPLVIKITIN